MTRTKWQAPRILCTAVVILALLAGNLARGVSPAAAASPNAAWAWGNNRAAELGFELASRLSQRPTPTQVLGAGASDVVALAAGRRHNLLVKPGGVLYTWGDNSRGQLGTGSTAANSNRPGQVTALNGVTAIAAGGLHSLVVANALVYGWGDNTQGQLGAGTSDSCAGSGCSRAPVPIALPVAATGVGAGSYHSLAIVPGGQLWAWGSNSHGQLGGGSTVATSSIPVPVEGLAGVIAVTGGEAHTLALKGDGSVWAWGSNVYGQLGNGGADGDKHATPVAVPGLAGVVAIAAGSRHNLALRSDGTIWAWGYNVNGELGAGDNGSPNPTPRQVFGLTNVVAIAAGDNHSLAVQAGGAVWAWGSNAYYQLGNTAGGPRVAPVQVAGISGAVMVAGGGNHSLALRTFTVPSFPDVPGEHPNYEAIGQLAARSVIRGYQDGRFGPEDTTLRAQMAALIARAMGWDQEDHGTPFPDQGSVDDDLWRNVGTLAYYNVALGYPDGLYRPTDNVLHAQTISFITRAMVARGAWVKQADNPALYPNVPTRSGHRQDIATYVYYAGALPGTASPTQPWASWNAPSTRAWFAEALWQAISR